MLATHHPHALYTSSVILPDSLVDFLASIGPIDTEENLKRYLAGEGWYWWKKHGKHLFEFLSEEVVIPPFEPLPPKEQKGKRPYASIAEEIFSTESQSSTYVESQSEDHEMVLAGASPNPAPATSTGASPNPAPFTSTTPSAKRQRLSDNIATSVPPNNPANSDKRTTSYPPPVPSTPRPPLLPPPQRFLPTPTPTPVQSNAPPALRPRLPSDNHPNAYDYLREFQAFCAQQPPPSASNVGSLQPSQARHAPSSDLQMRHQAAAYPTPSRSPPRNYSQNSAARPPQDGTT